MSGNPFEEEPTLIRPEPGGVSRTSAFIPRPAEPPPVRSRGFSGGPVELPATGASPLLAAVAPLLHLLARLAVADMPPDTAALRQSIVAALERFREKALALGFREAVVTKSHYVLCASLDDVVMNAPWSARSRWKDNSLVAEYHRNVSAGEGFFEELDRLRRNPVESLPLLELMYYCLSLGFMGRYRPSLDPNGGAMHETLRRELFDILRRFTPRAETELAPRWRGEDAPYRPSRAVLPAWAVAAGVVVCLLLLFIALSGVLTRSSNAVLLAANGTVPPMPALQRAASPRPLPAAPAYQPSAAAAQIHQFLEREIAEGLVTVDESPTMTRVRIQGSGMFNSGVATVNPKFVPLLQRIGAALNSEPGRVRLTGHSDNQPVQTIRFHSNLELSAARAEAARAIIAAVMQQPGRLMAEGRADLENLLPNDTPAGRAANRRIEVLLQRQD